MNIYSKLKYNYFLIQQSYKIFHDIFSFLLDFEGLMCLFLKFNVINVEFFLKTRFIEKYKLYILNMTFNLTFLLIEF